MTIEPSTPAGQNPYESNLVPKIDELLLKTDAKNLKVESLGESKFRLTALGLDKEVTILADQVLEIRGPGQAGDHPAQAPDL